MARRPQIEFRKIKRTDVPWWTPITKPVVEPKGSQWDKALSALDETADAAIRVSEPDTNRRNRLKSTLQTIAKNRGLNIQIRTQNEFIYAWRIDEPGRFSPARSN